MRQSTATYNNQADRVQASAPEEWRAQGAADRPDAVRDGIVITSKDRATAALAEADGKATSRHGAGKSKPSPTSEVGHDVSTNEDSSSMHEKQRRINLKAAMSDAAITELDDSEELEGVEEPYRAGKSANRLASLRRAKSMAEPAPSNSAKRNASKKIARETAEKANKERMAKLAMAKAQEAAAAKSAAAGAGAAAATAGEGAAAAGGIASAAAPVAGVVAGIVAFAIGALLVSQLVSAIFGFWENEANKQMVEGLPPYITYEMVEAALDAQEKYGHPAGCTLAQIIVESGMGDHLSGLATRDHNLFGMKWASSFAMCPEVKGKVSYVTGEEASDGSHYTITANFIAFNSDVDCIKFRSRVFLQASHYAGNAKIREAIAEHDSDKMAEGLKAAGWATDSSYVESLKSVMDTYGLRRFDTMSVEDLQEAGEKGASIVAAAYSQLGVPYVWGGSTPGVGLDCSGLTQYCYRQVGIRISHYTEDQKDELRHVPLSQAKPGDVLYKPGHVAIYIGGDKYIHEPHTGDVCRIATGINYFSYALTWR